MDTPTKNVDAAVDGIIEAIRATPKLGTALDQSSPATYNRLRQQLVQWVTSAVLIGVK